MFQAIDESFWLILFLDIISLNKTIFHLWTRDMCFFKSYLFEKLDPHIELL